ncbi:MAG: hypothetical protein E6Q89_05950 [Bacteroidia bacterium]|nr:MAG: hypothetical protein E6Q89_05950 [Bacteroidia bacterium]
MKSASGGLFLSQVYYWWSNKSGDWNYKFNQDFMEELGLSEWELRKAKERAIELKIIDFKLGKVGKLANVPFYKINEDALIEHLHKLSQTSSKPTKISTFDAIEDSSVGIENHSIGHEEYTIGVEESSIHLESVSQPLYTEITTKDYSDNTTNNKNDQTQVLELTSEPEIKAVSCNNSSSKNNDLAFDYTGFDEPQKTAITAWFTYRKEAKKTYKTKSSLTALRNKMLELRASGLLIEAINHSIAMEYTGLFAPNNTSRYQQSGSPPKKQFNYVHDFTTEKPGQQVDTF